MPKKQKEKTPEECLAEMCSFLKEDFACWQKYYTKGGQDPFYTDGENMVFVRRRICNFKEKAEKLCKENRLGRPEILDRPIPPEVAEDYMARKDDILIQAKKTLAEAKMCEAYLYLQSVKDDVLKHKGLAEKTHILSVLGYVSRLERAITEGDFMTMRTCGNPKFKMLASFEQCAMKVKAELTEIESQKINGFSIQANGQLNLFG